MTKEEILKIIDQNRDVLTPENYLGILKNVDIFNEDEKKRIVEYLRVAKEMLRVNQDFMKKQNALLRKADSDLKGMGDQIQRQAMFKRKEDEDEQSKKEGSEADDLLSSL
ncbi:hypothetical protein HZA44_01265 [Candidatus Peregrinibacteria bacterium]|nr:hypothetical protein [Candidatus Peregrinibacteria bacterium]